MTNIPVATIFLPGPHDTEAFARRLAERVGVGDTLLLEGPIGAGKTHFARALIGARLAAAGVPAEDVPSPTYTLVQTYHAGAVPIWHADLYRIAHPDEIAELGLQDAFETALCLVEWPDRLGEALPPDFLTLRFDLPPGDNVRTVTILPHGPRARAIAAGVSGTN